MDMHFVNAESLAPAQKPRKGDSSRNRNLKQIKQKVRLIGEGKIVELA